MAAENIWKAGRSGSREFCLSSQIVLHLLVDLVRGGDVLRIHLGHYELAKQLNLLYLRERDFVANLNRLQITHRRPVLQLKVLEGGLLNLEVLGLRLGGGQRAIEGIERGLDGDLRLWTPAVDVAL